MSSRTKLSRDDHSVHQAHDGLVRVDVQVSPDDAGLIRQAAAALADPARRTATRMAITHSLVDAPCIGFKALLAAAPLEGIDLERADDFGRTLDL